MTKIPALVSPRVLLGNALSHARQWAPGVVLLATLAGCAADPGEDGTAFGTAGPAVSGSSGSMEPEGSSAATSTTGDETAGEASTEADASASGTDDPGLLLDVGSATSGPARDGCRSVDVLFVFDSTQSMGSLWSSDNFSTLRDAWSQALVDGLPPDVDLHLGITTGIFMDNAPAGVAALPDPPEDCTGTCATADAGGALAETYIVPTDAVVNHPLNATQGRLVPLADESRWFEIAADEPNRDETIADAAYQLLLRARGYINGGQCGLPGAYDSHMTYPIEYVTAATAYALNPVNEPYNGGFIRDEGALLAIIVISDEVDQSPEPLGSYVDMVRQAKGDCGEECIVAAGFLPECALDSSLDVGWNFLTQLDPLAVHAPIEAFLSGDAEVISQTVSELGARLESGCAVVPPAG